MHFSFDITKINEIFIELFVKCISYFYIDQAVFREGENTAF
jgi:hypothetical protein